MGSPISQAFQCSLGALKTKRVLQQPQVIVAFEIVIKSLLVEEVRRGAEHSGDNRHNAEQRNNEGQAAPKRQRDEPPGPVNDAAQLQDDERDA